MNESLPTSLMDIDSTYLPVGQMRLISRVTAFGGPSIRGEVDLGAAHWVFPQHFPGDPIFPGSLIVEAAGQILALWAWGQGARGRPRLVRIGAEFRSPVGPSAALYTPDFYSACAARLRPNGGMTLHVASPVAHPERVRETIANLRTAFAVVTPYLTSVPLYGGMWMMACCSASLDPKGMSILNVDRRIAQRGIRDLQYYNGDMHRAALALPNFVRSLVG